MSPGPLLCHLGDRAMLLGRVLAGPFVWRNQRRHPKNFPLQRRGVVYGRPLLVRTTGQRLVVGLSNEPALRPSTEESVQAQLAVEIVEAAPSAGRTVTLESPESAVARLLVPRAAEVEINGSSGVRTRTRLSPFRLHPVSLTAGERVTVTSKRLIYSARPIPTQQARETSRDCVVLLFIDGLVTPETVAECMPEHREVFEPIRRCAGDGLYLANHFANAEWTLASYPTVLTGLYQSSHGLFHPTVEHAVCAQSAPLGEALAAAGYLTSTIGGNPRTVPSYGVHRGFQQQYFRQFMSAGEVFTRAWRTLDDFPDRRHALLLQVMDLHHADPHDRVEYRVVADGPDTQRSERKSPFRIGSRASREAYLARLRRVLPEIERFVDGVRRRFERPAILIWTDHGDAAFGADGYPLSDARIHVPAWMIGGREQGSIAAMTENVDLYRLVLETAGASFPSSPIDSRPIASSAAERRAAYSESRYPGQPYRGRLRAPGGEVRLESAELVAENGWIDPATIWITSRSGTTRQLRLHGGSELPPSDGEALAYAREVAARWLPAEAQR